MACILKINGYHEKCWIFPLLLNLIALTFFACASKQALPPESKVIEKPEKPVAQAEASWQQEWEELIEAAKKEGRLTIYGSVEHDKAEVLRKNFGKKYNIAIGMVTARSEELAQKVAMERLNGLYIPDVYMEGWTALLHFKPGILQPLDKVVFRPDVLDEKIWWKGHGPYFDKNHLLVSCNHYNLTYG